MSSTLNTSMLRKGANPYAAYYFSKFVFPQWEQEQVIAINNRMTLAQRTTKLNELFDEQEDTSTSAILEEPTVTESDVPQKIKELESIK